MENNNENLKHKAYYEGLKFKNSGLEEEVIYAKLEKQGIPIDLAKEVAMNVVIERNKYNKEDFSDTKKLGIIIIVILMLISIIAYIFTGRIIVLGLFVTVIPTAILAHLMTTTK